MTQAEANARLAGLSAADRARLQTAATAADRSLTEQLIFESTSARAATANGTAAAAATNARMTEAEAAAQLARMNAAQRARLQTAATAGNRSLTDQIILDSIANGSGTVSGSVGPRLGDLGATNGTAAVGDTENGSAGPTNAAQTAGARVGGSDASGGATAESVGDVTDAQIESMTLDDAERRLTRLQTEHDQERNRVLREVRATDEYRKIATQLRQTGETVEKVHASEGGAADPARVEPLAAQRLAVNSKLTKMEQDALAKDSKYQAAKARFDRAAIIRDVIREETQPAAGPNPATLNRVPAPAAR
jgi:hypothetical protein